MKSLQILLEHCYGIKRLEHKFSFNAPAFAIYAPNGAMKSSFANTFDDVSQGQKTVDRIFSDRETTRSIKVEDGDDLGKDHVLVISPYDEVLGHTERTSTLLINPKLRGEYDSLNKETEEAKARLLSSIKAKIRVKKGFFQRDINRIYTK